MAEKFYNIGCIGFGARGSSLCSAIQTYFPDQGKIGAIADPRDVQIPEEFARVNSELQVYRDYQDLLKEKSIDIVIITTREPSHFSIIEHSLDAGKAVLCDKPIVPNLEEAAKLYHRLQQGNPFFRIGLELTFDSTTKKIKEILGNGVLGKIVCVQAFTNTGSDFGRNVVLNRFSDPLSLRSDFVFAKLTHDTDLIQFILNTYAEEVCGKVANQHWRRRGCHAVTNDTAVISGKYNNDVLFTHVLTSVGPKYEREYHFTGVNGEMRVYFDRGEFRIHLNYQDSYIDKVQLGSGGHGGADVNMLQAFFDEIGREGEQEAQEVDRRVLSSIMIPLAAIRSSKEGKIIRTGEWYRNVLNMQD